MKKLMLAAAFVAGTFFSTNAQVHVSINIGAQPAWGPTGYDHADYYYLPDADAYYDITARMFWFMDGGAWRSAPSLPGKWANYDLYHAHKVVINNDHNPWIHNDRYHKKYASFAGRHDQTAIRDSHDQKYYQNPGHPQYAQWQKNHGNDNHGHNDQGHDNGHGHDDHGHGNQGHDDHGRH